MAKQTSVECFLREIGKYMDTWNIPDEVIEKAYEMHKKEIKTAFNVGNLSAYDSNRIQSSEEYYNETYKNDKQTTI